MIRTTSLALALALGFAVPGWSQVGGDTPLRTQGGPVPQRGGPMGSDPAPIVPQLQAVEQSLRNAERQITTQPDRQPPNFDQALRAVMAGQETLAELGQASGGRNDGLVQDAERQLSEARRMLETQAPQREAVARQLGQAVTAVTALAGAPNAATGSGAPGQPAAGGGAAR